MRLLALQALVLQIRGRLIVHENVLHSETITGLTVARSRFRTVQRADDDEAEAFAFLPADCDVTRLRFGGRRPV